MSLKPFRFVLFALALLAVPAVAVAQPNPKPVAPVQNVDPAPVVPGQNGPPPVPAETTARRRSRSRR